MEIKIKEELLEPLLRRLRINQILPFIKSYPNTKLLDIGCGWECRLLKNLKPYIRQGVGIDFKAPNLVDEKLTAIQTTIVDRLPFEDKSFDFITLLAVLEHLENEEAILQECSRVLKPNGGLLITVPSWNAKPILEFLSFRLGIVNPVEIRDHKRYYDKSDLYTLFEKLDHLKIEKHKYFQLGCNNLLFAKKIN